MKLETTDNVPVLSTRIIDDTTVRINFDGAEWDGERNGDKFAVIDISGACSTVDINRNEDDLSATPTMVWGMDNRKVSKVLKEEINISRLISKT